MKKQKGVDATSEGKNRIYLGKDGIIYMNINNVLTEKDIEDLLGELRTILGLNPGESKVLIDVNAYPLDALALSPVRKMIAEEIKKISKHPGYKKTAIFTDNVVVKTVASFVVTASKTDKIEVFTSRDKAIKWLKEP